MNLKGFYSRVLFCLSVSRNISTAYNLIFQPRKFNLIYKGKMGVVYTKVAPMKYKLKMFGKKFDVYMRTETGDIAIFFEIFYQKMYDVPKELLNDPLIIIDLGANIGCTSIYFALKYPSAKIISVEPSVETYKLLDKNTSRFKNILIRNKAVWSETKEISFSEEKFAYNSKVSIEGLNTYNIEAISISELLGKENIDKVDLMKIDIEGGEEKILQHNNLWLDNVENIIIELHKPYSNEEFEQNINPFGFIAFQPPAKNLKMVYATKIK